MRKPRSLLYNFEGYFHIESSLHPQLDNFTAEDAHAALKRFQSILTLHDIKLIFWQFHPQGIEAIIRRDTSYQHPAEQKAAAYRELGEEHLSHYCLSPETTHLNAHQTLVKDTFEARQHDLQEALKIAKQRITINYNNIHKTKGSLWKERLKLFRLPTSAQELSEVAAFILARAQVNTNECLEDWPSSYTAAIAQDAIATGGVNKIFQDQSSTEKQLQNLKTKRDEIAQKLDQPARRTNGTRGRACKWRPDCELRPEATQQYPATNKENQHEQETDHFLDMLEQYKAYHAKTQLKQIPEHEHNNPELKKWIASVRSQYQREQLAYWQIALLKRTPLLDRSQAKRTNPSKSSIWMHQYQALEAYFKQNGHSQLPRTGSQDQTLANWTWTQRAKRRKERLSEQQIKLLNKLNFNWNPPTEH